MTNPGHRRCKNKQHVNTLCKVSLIKMSDWLHKFKKEAKLNPFENNVTNSLFGEKMR